MTEFQVLALFPTPVYMSTVEVDDNIVTAVKQTSYTWIQPKNDAWRSSSTHILDLPEYQYIREEILKHVNHFIKNICLVKAAITFELKNSWIMKHEKGDYAEKHYHINSVLSGILYIEGDESSGDIVFRKNMGYQTLFPGNLAFDTSEFNVLNADNWQFTPKKNLLLIFPSHLEHEVEPSKSNNARYCIAFNLFPSGDLRLNDITELKLK